MSVSGLFWRHTNEKEDFAREMKKGTRLPKKAIGHFLTGTTKKQKQLSEKLRQHVLTVQPEANEKHIRVRNVVGYTYNCLVSHVEVVGSRTVLDFCRVKELHDSQYYPIER